MESSRWEELNTHCLAANVVYFSLLKKTKVIPVSSFQRRTITLTVADTKVCQYLLTTYLPNTKIEVKCPSGNLGDGKVEVNLKKLIDIG